MNILSDKTKKRFSYGDYLTWSDDERWEIIDGVPYNMTPAPTFRHQRVVGLFYAILERELSGGPCIPGISPLDVVLSEYDVVQPDIIVICDKKKITEENIKGAPDLIVEVISPSTALKDKREKKNLYERSGVKEYIIVNPQDYYVERFILRDEGTYGSGEIYGAREILSLSSINGIDILLWEVFEVERPESKS